MATLRLPTGKVAPRLLCARGDPGVSAESPLIAARNETQRSPPATRPAQPAEAPAKTKAERVGAESEAPANNAVTSQEEKGASRAGLLDKHLARAKREREDGVAPRTPTVSYTTALFNYLQSDKQS